MLLASFPAGPLAANCYVVAEKPGRDCVVIDPGMESSDTIDGIVTQERLKPVAVLLTHGHVDHCADAAAVADRYGADCVIGRGDRAQLSDPLSGLPTSMHPLVADLIEPHPPEPRAMRELDPAAGPQMLAGLEFSLLAAPGHTPGSTLYALKVPAESADSGLAGDDGPELVVFTGDVIFANSVGRTDLPGGDQEAMSHTLADVVLSLPDATVLLPGHGPQTTVGRERAQNPFLQN